MFDDTIDEVSFDDLGWGAAFYQSPREATLCELERSIGPLTREQIESWSRGYNRGWSDRVTHEADQQARDRSADVPADQIPF